MREQASGQEHFEAVLLLGEIVIVLGGGSKPVVYKVIICRKEVTTDNFLSPALPYNLLSQTERA